MPFTNCQYTQLSLECKKLMTAVLFCTDSPTFSVCNGYESSEFLTLKFQQEVSFRFTLNPCKGFALPPNAIFFWSVLSLTDVSRVTNVTVVLARDTLLCINFWYTVNPLLSLPLSNKPPFSNKPPPFQRETVNKSPRSFLEHPTTPPYYSSLHRIIKHDRKTLCGLIHYM